MDIKQMHCFVELSKELNFSRASQNLHMSQPALSKNIQGMEKELKLMLFDRSTRHLQLPTEGEALLPHAKQLLRQMEDFMQVAEEQNQSHAGTIRFGLPPVIGSSFFPGLIAAFRKKHPEIELTIIEEGSRVVEESLLDGEVDLGVTILPSEPDPFEVTPVIEKKLKLVLPIHHPLSKHESVSVAELKNEEFLMFNPGFTLYNQTRDACIEAGFEPDIMLVSSQWDFMMQMVASGNGICILPETICEQADREKCAVVDLIDPVLYWRLVILRRKESYLSKAAAVWIDFMMEAFRKMRME